MENFKTGRVYTFRFFDGCVESISDGGLGIEWIKEWARKNLYLQDIWRVDSGNASWKGYEFFTN